MGGLSTGFEPAESFPRHRLASFRGFCSISSLRYEMVPVHNFTECLVATRDSECSFSSLKEMADGLEELPRIRRPSLGILQAKRAKNYMQPEELVSGYTGSQEIFTMAKEILSLSEEIHSKTSVEFNLTIDEDFEMVSGDLECTGLIFLFAFGRGNAHYTPFVRVGDTWYNGDNEVGFLRKRTHLPSLFMQYEDPDGKIYATNYAKHCICFYAHPSLIRRERGSVEGTLVFGQTDNTCGPDALQTILMFADGFYEYYNQRLYSQLKGLFPSRRPKNMSELKGNIQALDKKKYVALLSNDTVTPESRGAIVFLLLMFSRYKYIELLDERAGETFEVVPNTSQRNLNRYEYERIKFYHSDKFNPLYQAVVNQARQTNTAALEKLLQYGEDPNIREANYDTPFLRAVTKGYIDVVKVFLKYREPRGERGALDINIPTVGAFVGYTPLMHACNNIHPEMVQILCEAGADVNKTDVQGKTALMIISRKSRDYSTDILAIVETLLRHGANPSLRDNDDKSALAYARDKDNLGLMKILSPLTVRGGRRTRRIRRTRRHRPNLRR